MRIDFTCGTEKITVERVDGYFHCPVDGCTQFTDHPDTARHHYTRVHSAARLRMQSESDDGSRRLAVTPRIDKGLALSPSSAMSLDSDTQAVQDLDDGTAFSIPDRVRSSSRIAVLRDEGSDVSDDSDEIDDEYEDPGEEGQIYNDLDEGEVRDYGEISDDEEISDEDELRDEDEDADSHMLSDRALRIRALTRGLGLIYDEKLACLVCVECEQVIPHSTTRQHLKKIHKHPPIIQQKINDLFSLITLRPLPDVEFPPNPCIGTPTDPISGVKVEMGFKCSVCRKVYGAKASIQKHVRQLHDGDGIILSQIPIQKIHTVPPQMFEVKGQPEMQATEADIQTQIGLFRRWTEKEKEITLPAPVRFGRGDLSPWMKASGIPEHLAGMNLIELRAKMEVPKRDCLSPEGHIARAVDRLVLHGIKLVKTCHNQLLRRWMASYEANSAGQEYFDVRDEATQEKYRMVCKRIIMYLLLSHADPQVQACLSRAQMDLVENILTWAEGPSRDDSDEVIEDLHKFCMSLIKYDSTWMGDFNSPLVHAMAVMAIDRRDGGFRKPAHISHEYAAVVYIARLLVLREAFITVENDIDSDGPIEIYCRLRRYLIPDTQTPVGWVIRMLHDTKGIQAKEDVKPSVSWGLDQTTLQVRGRSVSLTNWKSFVRYQLRQLVEIASQLACGDVESIDTQAIVDDISIQSVGYYFGEEADNAGILKAIELFAEKSQGKEGWFSYSEGKVQLDRAAVRDWLNRCDRLLQHMLLVFHLLGGQPARSTEVLSLRYRNNIFHGRNVFVYDGVLLTITAYSKMQWKTGKSSYVPRFLPGVVAKVYVAYITQILPVRRYLASLMAQDAGTEASEEFGSHIFCDQNGKLWEADVLSKLLQSETTLFGLPNINVSSYRHMAIALSRRFLRHTWEDLDEEESETNAHDAQANHSTRTANRVYGRPQELTSEVSVWQLSEMAPISIAWWSWHLEQGKESYAPRRIFVKFNNLRDVAGLQPSDAPPVPEEVQGPENSHVSENTIPEKANTHQTPDVPLRDQRQHTLAGPSGVTPRVRSAADIPGPPGHTASGARFNFNIPPPEPKEDVTFERSHKKRKASAPLHEFSDVSRTPASRQRKTRDNMDRSFPGVAAPGITSSSPIGSATDLSSTASQYGGSNLLAGPRAHKSPTIMIPMAGLSLRDGDGRDADRATELPGDKDRSRASIASHLHCRRLFLHLSPNSCR
jgi:hypothetical protein